MKAHRCAFSRTLGGAALAAVVMAVVAVMIVPVGYTSSKGVGNIPPHVAPGDGGIRQAHSGPETGLTKESVTFEPASQVNLANKVVATVAVGSDPMTPAYDSSNGDIYVPNGVPGNVSVISGVTDTLVATVPVGGGPDQPTFDPGNGNIYVPNVGTANVSVISGLTNRVVATIPVGSDPNPVAYDNVTGNLYVPNAESNTVSVISGATNSVIATISVGTNPWAPAVDTANGDVYVPNWLSSSVTVISGNTNTVIATVQVGGGPMPPTYDSANGEIYLPDIFDNTVTAINGTTNTVVATFAVGGSPFTPAYDELNGNLYFPCDVSSNTGVVRVISGETNLAVATVPVGSNPSTPVVDDSNGNLYVPNSGSGTVSVMSGSTNTVVAVVDVGNTPYTPAFDPSTGEVFVSNALTATVSVIAGGYPVTFTEIGLSSGSWSVSFAGASQSAPVGSPNVFDATNGAWSYFVGAVEGFLASPANGTVDVAGTPQAVAVTYSKGVAPTYLVTFIETGLEAGTNWTVTLDGLSQNSSESAMTFQISDGTHPFLVHTVEEYTETPARGNVTVDGSNWTEWVTFTRTSNSGPTFLGLPLFEGAAVVGGFCIVVAGIGVGSFLYRRRERKPPLTSSVG